MYGQGDDGDVEFLCGRHRAREGDTYTSLLRGRRGHIFEGLHCWDKQSFVGAHRSMLEAVMAYHGLSNRKLLVGARPVV